MWRSAFRNEIIKTIPVAVMVVWFVPLLWLGVEMLHFLGFIGAGFNPILALFVLIGFPFLFFLLLLVKKIIFIKSSRYEVLGYFDGLLGSRNRLNAADEFLNLNKPTAFHLAAIDDSKTILGKATSLNFKTLQGPTQEAEPLKKPQVLSLVLAVVFAALALMLSYLQNNKGGLSPQNNPILISGADDFRSGQSEHDSGLKPVISSPEEGLIAQDLARKKPNNKLSQSPQNKQPDMQDDADTGKAGSTDPKAKSSQRAETSNTDNQSSGAEGSAGDAGASAQSSDQNASIGQRRNASRQKQQAVKSENNSAAGSSASASAGGDNGSTDSSGAQGANKSGKSRKKAEDSEAAEAAAGGGGSEKDKNMVAAGLESGGASSSEESEAGENAMRMRGQPGANSSSSEGEGEPGEENDQGSEGKAGKTPQKGPGRGTGGERKNARGFANVGLTLPSRDNLKGKMSPDGPEEQKFKLTETTEKSSDQSMSGSRGEAAGAISGVQRKPMTKGDKEILRDYFKSLISETELKDD